jgi:hypothetical protein
VAYRGIKQGDNKNGGGEEEEMFGQGEWMD